MIPLSKPVRLRDNLIAHLISEIASGQIEAGAKLPPENELIAMSGLSRTVVREAVRTMEENGVLRVRQGFGTIVKEQRDWNVLDPTILDALLSNDEKRSLLVQLFDVRMALETLTVRAAAQNIVAEQSAHLEQLVGKMRRSMDAPDDYRELDLEFHDFLAEISGNQFAASIMRAIHHALSLSRDWTNQIPKGIEHAQKAHEDIAGKVIARNPDAAETAMGAHLEWALVRFRTLPIS